MLPDPVQAFCQRYMRNLEISHFKYQRTAVSLREKMTDRLQPRKNPGLGYIKGYTLFHISQGNISSIIPGEFQSGCRRV